MLMEPESQRDASAADRRGGSSLPQRLQVLAGVATFVVMLVLIVLVTL